MVETLFVTAAILVFPSLLQMQFLFGQAKLENVKTGWPLLDRLFNQRPLALSLVAGALCASAYLIQDKALPLAIAALACAAVLWIVNMGAASVSYYKYLRGRRRR